MYTIHYNALQPLISELRSFIQELKSQLTTLYHQFAPLPAPPEDDEQLREKLNRLYIGASSVTERPPCTDTGAAAVGDISSHAQEVQSMSAVPAPMTEPGLPQPQLQSSAGEEGETYVCTATHEGEGEEEEEEGMEGVPHYTTTAVTTGDASTIAPNDMHVSDDLGLPSDVW